MKFTRNKSNIYSWLFIWRCYSSGKWNPSKTNSSSSPGGGKCARMQETAHDGNTTLISQWYPNTISQAGSRQYAYLICVLGHLTLWILLPVLVPGCLQNHLFRHIALNPGWSVMQDGNGPVTSVLHYFYWLLLVPPGRAYIPYSYPLFGSFHTCTWNVFFANNFRCKMLKYT